MHVSPANDRDEVNIASDSEVQNVIAFLSGNTYDSPFEYQNKSNEEVRGEGQQQRPGDYTYSPIEYSGHMTNYHEGQYGGVASGRDGGEEDWSLPATLDQKDSEKPPHERSSAVGGQRKGGNGGGEDGYVFVSRDKIVGSRSASTSPGAEGKDMEDLRVGQPPNPNKDGRGRRGEDDKRYRQHNNPHSNLPKKKGGWGERRELPHPDGAREASRDPQEQELSLVFSKGFGQLITSEPGRSGGMDLLHDSPDYQLSLRLLKGMNDDSDSERSG